MTRRSALFTLALAAAGCGASSTPPRSSAPVGGKADDVGGGAAAGDAGGAIKTVFLIVLENHNWSDIAGSSSAPFINQVLLPEASHANQYFNPPNNHPSETNYVWLEAGDNLGISNDNDPKDNHRSTTEHLVTQLRSAGVSWRSYQEDIDGTSCPLGGVKLYAPRHDPMVFFDDVTDGNSPSSANCIEHVRPFGELAGDLDANTVARYNFITPNLCDDMHGSVGAGSLGFTFDCLPPFADLVQRGDDWLSRVVPQIMASQAYQDGGAIFITWDESEGGDFPIGMIVLSPLAKGGGYANDVHYTHSSTLRTLQEIFGVGPFLRDAANATSLSDLFQTYP